MESGALILFCIVVVVALLLLFLMYANRYRAIQIEQTAGKQAPNPLVEQIEQRKRAALNAVKEQLEQIAQRTQTQEQIRKEERKQVQDLVARTEILDTEIQSFKNILVKHRDLVDKFLEIAERKVSVLDDYGDENRDALLEEIDKCLAKIAKREPSVDLSKWTKREQPLHGIAGTYKSHCALNLQIMLIQKFSPYHEGRKTVSNNVVQDFSKLTGVDFEVYVANRLKEAGFESVAGTPATWDQGADLIAKRNGKTIAIQAKGCSDTVGNGAVQEIVGALKYYKADEGWVVTNSTFTASARSLAQVNNIRLIDGHDLKTLKTPMIFGEAGVSLVYAPLLVTSSAWAGFSPPTPDFSSQTTVIPVTDMPADPVRQ